MIIKKYHFLCYNKKVMCYYKMKKNRITTIILIIVFLMGLFLVMYPTVSEWWNSWHQTRAIVSYEEQSMELYETIYETMLEEAKSYNQTLVEDADRLHITDDERAKYKEYLCVPNTDVMGYIEIEKINCRLPIYHGTGEEFLQIGVGHMEGTSLPIGGESTHAVLSGHSGLPSTRLFTDLDQLEEGDIFRIYVLNKILEYKVDQIQVVEPDEVDELAIVEGEDYCTLLTCTPYGINTHRLLVRGHRVETTVSSEIEQVEPKGDLALIIFAITFVVLVIVVALWIWRKKRDKLYKK